jgi:DNA-directed RNA polymerase subunit RPC12/RpoP
MRFRARVWRLRDLIYARCPNCFCEVLARWSTSDYGVTLWMGIRLLFGAQPYYCARCRRRFVSFRPRKPRASRSKGLEGDAPSQPSRRAAWTATD